MARCGSPFPTGGWFRRRPQQSRATPTLFVHSSAMLPMAVASGRATTSISTGPWPPCSHTPHGTTRGAPHGCKGSAPVQLNRPSRRQRRSRHD